jgi:hypothetical protein
MHYYFSMFFLFLYIYIYICVYIHSVAHLNMSTFVQEHLLYLIVYHDMKIDCNNTDIDLTNGWFCLFMIIEPGITKCPYH